MLPIGGDLDEPIVKCPYWFAGRLTVEVLKYRANTLNAPKTPLGGVKASVSGPTKKVPPLNTASGDGRGSTGKLKPGQYQVDLDFPGDMALTLDLDAAVITKTKEVKKNKSTSFVFQIPYNWVQYEVRYEDDSWAPGFQIVLQRKKKTSTGFEASWTALLEGKSMTGTISEEPVPAGRYQLAVKALSAPAWSADKVVAGDAIDLKALVSGFKVGEAGAIEILDANDFTTSIHTIACTVSDDAGQTVLKTAWTPLKTQFSTLKNGNVVFRAKIGVYTTISEVRPVYYKEPIEFEDDLGAKLTGKVKFCFSGGDVVEQDVSNGRADVVWPWTQQLARIDLPDHRGRRLDLDADGLPVRTLSIAN